MLLFREQQNVTCNHRCNLFIYYIEMLFHECINWIDLIILGMEEGTAGNNVTYKLTLAVSETATSNYTLWQLIAKMYEYTEVREKCFIWWFWTMSVCLCVGLSVLLVCLFIFFCSVSSRSPWVTAGDVWWLWDVDDFLNDCDHDGCNNDFYGI